MYLSANVRQLTRLRAQRSYSGTKTKPTFVRFHSHRERETATQATEPIVSFLSARHRRRRRKKVSLSGLSGYFYPISLRTFVRPSVRPSLREVARPEQRGAEPRLLPTLYNRKAARAFSAFSSYCVARSLESRLGILPGKEGRGVGICAQLRSP